MPRSTCASRSRSKRTEFLEAVGAGVYEIAYQLPVLTFDFGHFRATQCRHGYWRLVIDEQQYAEATR